MTSNQPDRLTVNGLPVQLMRLTVEVTMDAYVVTDPCVGDVIQPGAIFAVERIQQEVTDAVVQRAGWLVDTEAGDALAVVDEATVRLTGASLLADQRTQDELRNLVEGRAQEL